ncbi:MAG: hypothetical protein ACUVWZ_01975 [Anaerolineae bacterium]
MSGIEELLTRVRAQIDLDGETEYQVLAEVRDHLEEAMARARAEGLDEAKALARVAARFGLEEAGSELQATHAGWGTADAVVAAGLPVLCALVLRWLAFAPDGTVLGWPQLLNRPAFWIVAVVVLLIPLLKFERWRYALVTWVIFWTLTVMFVTLPALRW